MAEAPPPEYLKWGPLIERMIITAYYRVLSFTSLHAPIWEVYKACEYMSRNTPYGGTIHSLIPNRVFNWENITVNKNPEYPVTMDMRIFGSPLRGKNTIFARLGWWKLYMVDVTLMFIGALLERS